MQFQDLSEDDIRSIFSFCDIHTVVSMSRTNKYLRQLTLEKLVWVDLVDNIRRKGFIDRLSLSDIQAYSQKALVSLVKGLLTGPTSWNVPITPKLPCLARFQSNIPPPMALSPAQFVIHPSGIRASKKNEAKLLGGGKYVLFNNITLECWSVQHDRLVWSYEKSDPNSYVIEFDAEVSDAGENANIIVCQRSWTTTGDDQSLVEIRKLNFQKGVSTRLLLVALPDTESYSFTATKICGNIACASLEALSDVPQNYCILMNWQNTSYLKLVSNTLTSPFLVNLIPNHILVMTNNISGAPELSVINDTGLASHWRHTLDHPTLYTVYTSEIQAIVREIITFGNCARFRYPLKRELCTYESPIEEGTYRVWTHLSGYSTSSSDKHAVICSYHLSLPNRAGDGIKWRKRTAAPTDPSRNCPGIPYSGHTRQYYPNHNSSDLHTIFTPGDPNQVVKLKLPGCPPYAQISAYSGALAYSTDNTVVISYFDCSMSMYN